MTINGLGKSSIFSVRGENTDATFEGLTLTGGFSTAGGAAFLVEDGVVKINHTAISNMISSGADVKGGAISILQGDVTLNSSTVKLSKATSVNGNASGGAISNAGILAIVTSKITNNTATALLDARGGGIFSSNTLTITDSLPPEVCIPLRCPA